MVTYQWAKRLSGSYRPMELESLKLRVRLKCRVKLNIHTLTHIIDQI